MNGNFLLLANEIWIKLDRMIVDLKSLKRGFQDERTWHEDWDHREYERHRQEMWDAKFLSDLTVMEYRSRFGKPLGQASLIGFANTAQVSSEKPDAFPERQC